MHCLWTWKTEVGHNVKARVWTGDYPDGAYGKAMRGYWGSSKFIQQTELYSRGAWFGLKLKSRFFSNLRTFLDFCCLSDKRAKKYQDNVSHMVIAWRSLPECILIIRIVPYVLCDHLRDNSDNICIERERERGIAMFAVLLFKRITVKKKGL